MLLRKKKKLKREIIAKKLWNLRKYNYDTDKYVKEFIKIIKSYFDDSVFESDEDFIFCGRKKFLYDEFYDYLDDNIDYNVDKSIRLATGNLFEFILNPNFVYFSDGDAWEKGWNDLRDRNDNYTKKGYICLEEKEYIEKMMDRLYEEINDSSKNIDDIVENLIIKVKDLAINTSFSVSSLLGSDSIKNYNNEELNRIAHDFIDECYKLNIDLDFPNSGTKTGQLYTIQYIKK